MDKTCKSNGTIVVAIRLLFSGARVRNTWAICREVWDNLLKGELIPDVVTGGHLPGTKVGDPALSGTMEVQENEGVKWGGNLLGWMVFESAGPDAS